jgi:hypothetical protein
MRQRGVDWDARAKLLLLLGAAGVLVPLACGRQPERTTAGPRRITSTTSSAGGSGATTLTTTSVPVCGASCLHDQAGAGTGDPFGLADHESSNVAVDADGAVVVVTKSAPKGKDLIWIASSEGGFVSKFDTKTFAELGRYQTGVDPSRTSVDLQGDVYVANRAGQSVVKVSSAGKDCPDTNGDGQVTTSDGSASLYSYGVDDCVLWTRGLSHVLRGAAAQQRPPEADGTSKSDVWVGTLDGFVWKLDGDTGQVLLKAESPCPVYGLALDGAGQLWMTHQSCLGRIDTKRCHDSSSCAKLAVCTTSCTSGGSCSDSCDDAGMQAITLPASTYGITVDFKGRVWLGGEAVQRYSPHAPSGSRYKAQPAVDFVHGIAADGAGFVWGAAVPNVVRVDAETLDVVKIATPSSKGMAVDRDGKVWAVSYQQPFATVIVPGPKLGDQKVLKNVVTSLEGPYTYSDMTGVQAALATGATGRYVQRFTGCADTDTAWIDVGWTADVPDGTFLRFRARTGANAAVMAGAPWVDVAVVPSDTPPASVAGPLGAAGLPPGHLLDVEVTFTVTGTAASPKLTGLSAGYLCPKPTQPN